jgi:hypothetical protein
MKNKTTWQDIEGTWRSGKTKTIRVPIALAPQLLKIARLLDTGLDPVEYKIIEFELLKQKQYQRTKKHFDRSTPRWAVFNEFQWWLRSGLAKW